MKKIIFLAASVLAAASVSAQSRSALIHMKSGEIVEFEYSDISHISFTDPVMYDLDMAASNAYVAYHGSGEYILCLSDKPLSGKGEATEVGQIVLRLNPIADEPADSHVSVNLAAGRYVSDIVEDVNTLPLNDNDFCVEVCTALEDGEAAVTRLPLNDGTLNVSYAADGSCVLQFKGGFSESQPELGDVSELRVTFSGRVATDNQDPYFYNWLEEDVNVVPYEMTGTYRTYKDVYGNYSLVFVNVPHDESGYATGAGYVVNLEILTEYSEHLDVTKMAGEYTVTSALSGPYEPGNYMNGEMYYGIAAIGSFLSIYNEDGSRDGYGLVVGGQVKVSVDGDNVTYTLDLETESGKHFTLDYTASATETIQDKTVK